MCAEHRFSGARLAWVALVLLLVVSRLAWLGDRQPHQDEMSHAAFGERLALRGSYVADPVFHGPLLYHLEAAVVRVAGPGLWQSRLVPALAGILAAAWLALLVGRQAGARTGIGVGALASISPSWLYYSRFAGHDTLVLLVAVALAWAVDAWERGRGREAAWVGVLAMAAGWATKLNVLFLVVAVLGWGVLRGLAGRANGSPPPARLPIRAVAAATGVAVVVVAALFVSTLLGVLRDATLPEAVWITIRRATVDGILHWSQMHGQQRIPGPADYHVVLVALYEPLLIVGSAALAWRSWRDSRVPWWLGPALLAAGLAMAVAGRYAEGTLAALSMKPAHLAVVPLVAGVAGVALLQALRSGRTWLGFWIWLAATQGALYAVAGEKTPWLVLHTVLPLLPIAAFGILGAWEHATHTRGRVVFGGIVAAGAIVAVHGSIALTTYNRSNVGEPLVQVEYDTQTHDVLREVAQACLSMPSTTPCIVTTDDAAWPAEWYLRWHPAGARAVSTDAAAVTAATPFVFVRASDVVPVSTGTHEPRRTRFASAGRWMAAIRGGDWRSVLRFLAFREPLGTRVAVPYIHWRHRDKYSHE